MEEPYITLHTKTQTSFRHTDGFEGVSVTDLEMLLRQGREVTAALEGELMKRHHQRTSDQPGELGKCCERLHNTAREINVMERVDGRAAKQVDDAVEILTTVQTSKPSKTYQAFLHDILRHCSRSLVLLCAASFGKKRIVDLGLKDRVSLLAYMRDTRLSLGSSVLETLANDHQIPSLTNIVECISNLSPPNGAHRLLTATHSSGLPSALFAWEMIGSQRPRDGILGLENLNCGATWRRIWQRLVGRCNPLTCHAACASRARPPFSFTWKTSTTYI